MLTVSFAALRSGPVVRTWRLDDPASVLGDVPPGLGEVRVEVEVDGDARDGVRARGRLSTRVEVACRRCLAPVTVPVETGFDLLFRPESEMSGDEEGVWRIGAEGDAIDLAPAIREELWVTTPDYIVCDPDCPGLCDGCGARLGSEPCTCPPPEPDPRWAALERLQAGGAGAAESSGTDGPEAADTCREA